MTMGDFHSASEGVACGRARMLQTLVAATALCLTGGCDGKAQPAAAPSTTATTRAPTVPPSGRRLASGEHFVCLLDDARRVRCWGQTLGTARPGAAAELTTIDGMQGAEELAANADTICARMPNGTVLCTKMESCSAGAVARAAMASPRMYGPRAA